ncbi:helix-turn-helix domain-containing protein [Nocardia thailandica]
MDHIPAALGQSVREAVTDAGLSIRKVAEETGIAFATLQRKLKGHTRSTFDVVELHQIATLLDRPTASLLPEELQR